MTEITIADIRIGMKLKLNKMAGFEYIEWGRVEAVGHDWVVVRAGNDTVHLLAEDLDFIEKYVDEEEEDDKWVDSEVEARFFRLSKLMQSAHHIMSLTDQPTQYLQNTALNKT